MSDAAHRFSSASVLGLAAGAACLLTHGFCGLARAQAEVNVSASPGYDAAARLEHFADRPEDTLPSTHAWTQTGVYASSRKDASVLRQRLAAASLGDVHATRPIPSGVNPSSKTVPSAPAQTFRGPFAYRPENRLSARGIQRSSLAAYQSSTWSTRSTEHDPKMGGIKTAGKPKNSFKPHEFSHDAASKRSLVHPSHSSDAAPAY